LVNQVVHLNIVSSKKALGLREEAGSLFALRWRGRGLDRGSPLHIGFAANATR
jgi:hypothetical protein